MNTVRKHPLASVGVIANWTKALAIQPGATIQSVSTAPLIAIGDSALTIVSYTINTGVITPAGRQPILPYNGVILILSGGTLGVDYTIRMGVTFTNGWVDVKDFPLALSMNA